MPAKSTDFQHLDRPVRGLVIARLIEKKGIPYLIKAANELKDQNVVFDIYGFGELQEKYEEQISALGLSNIKLKGVINNQRELKAAYEAADFLIVPSVVAENGDMDGFPTVILEAMASSLPVITTDVSAIPDYLTDDVEAIVVPASDVGALVDGVNKLLSTPPEKLEAMVKRSKSFLRKMVDVEQSMGVMVDTWQSYSIDIFLVTYNTEDYEDRAETFEIIRRIFSKTTTPFTLTIVDNGSSPDFWEQLSELVSGHNNVRLIRKHQNQFCGPASNIALRMSDSKYAIYICSKEGFIKNHGWERSLIDFMRDRKDTVLGGHLSNIPTYVYGKEYINLPYFENFRNKDFALSHPEKPFLHVQGGVYILNREFYKEHGGFNDLVAHNGMDVEMSYYVESIGYKLGEIPEVASLTVKTRPTLNAILNERTVIAHPLTVETAKSDLDTLWKENGQRCNLCEWRGATFDNKNDFKNPLHDQCPQCKSTPFGRSIYRVLSNDHHIHRKEKCILVSFDKALGKKAQSLFNVLSTVGTIDELKAAVKKGKQQIDFFIIDPSLFKEQSEDELWKSVLEGLALNGEVLFADSTFEENSVIHDTVSDNVSINYLDFSSYCIAYDWRRIGRITRHAEES